MTKRPVRRPPVRSGRPAAGGGRRPPERPPQAGAAPPATAALATVDELELEIEKLVAGGDGLGRWRGIPVFVPRSAPGDRLRVRLVERRASFGRGEIVAILQPGAGRRRPPCPHFADCGGCDLQHLEEAAQLRAKSEATLETLRRISRLALPAPREIVVGAPFGYRLRTQVHLVRGADGVEVGYHARGSRRLVAVGACPILHPELERVVLALRETTASPLPSRIDLALGDGGEVAAAPPLPELPGGELVRRIGGFDYRFDARCFFQGHAGLVAPLVERTVGEPTGELAFDLYGGVGLFALPLARRYRSVTLVEGDRIAARYARKNVQGARLAIEVVSRAVESWAVSDLPAGADRVVVDPPRDGLPPALRRLLVLRQPARLTYVSCHAAALARDLAELGAAFAVESLVFVDLFPQTGHMESIVQLVHRSS